MCEYDTLTEVETIKAGTRKIDSCMADLIKILNQWGVKTLGCCCGHGKGRPNLTIDISGCEIRDYLLEPKLNDGKVILVRDVMLGLDNPNYDLTICGSCYSMTHTSSNGMCLKCGKKKKRPAKKKGKKK